MALLLNQKPALIEGINGLEEIEFQEIDAVLLMSLLEESHCEEYCNEEQVNSLMESLEAEIRMANHDDSCNVADMESNDGFDCLDWTDMETVPSSPSDDMNWYMEDHVEEMDGLMEFGNEFPQNYYEVPLEHGYLWQETYDAVICN
ncbi:hypothetical protein CCACVL1_16573 [Corchorus capsularis]|uniref:Uncharacterized protein n=1 Tax=Corchorus capsularis TaxID=210143 RepID=A0A1R3HWF8_COCAP|nr:hypothetical protein CCACVL1_16573 [Corchorus capsularis]